MKTNNIFRCFFLLALLLNSCASNDELRLKKLLDSSFKRQIHEGNIVVISEYDCMECLDAMRLKLSNQKGGKEIFGLFYHRKSFYKKEFADFMNRTPVKWSTVQDESIIHLTAKISQKTSGPYTIEISDNQIIKID